LLLELDSGLGGIPPERAREIYRELGERFAALPEVEASSIASTVPFGMISLSRSIQRAGLSVAADAKPASAAEGLAYRAHWNGVGANYFEAVGLRLLRGRGFNEAEFTRSSGPAVAVIDETLARKLWPDGDALGQQVQLAAPGTPTAGGAGGGAGIYEEGSSDLTAGEAIEIIGIVPTTRRAIFEKNMLGALYVPFTRAFQSNAFFQIRFRDDVAGVELARRAEVIRQIVRRVDPTLPIISLKTFPQHLESNLQLWLVRAGAALFSAFGALALLLAVVGVYGVKAYTVARRTREIGIRIALGARPETVLWMILRESALMLSLGVAIGLVLAVLTGRLVSNILYQVGALDPIAFTIAPIVLALAVLIACWLPARRATRVSPLQALRTE
jgi:ABC-type antimicrobial peptide transport system permease subunit